MNVIAASYHSHYYTVRSPPRPALVVIIVAVVRSFWRSHSLSATPLEARKMKPTASRRRCLRRATVTRSSASQQTNNPDSTWGGTPLVRCGQAIASAAMVFTTTTTTNDDDDNIATPKINTGDSGIIISMQRSDWFRFAGSVSVGCLHCDCCSRRHYSVAIGSFIYVSVNKDDYEAAGSISSFVRSLRDVVPCLNSAIIGSIIIIMTVWRVVSFSRTRLRWRLSLLVALKIKITRACC